MIQRINKATASMFENGICNFYRSFASFWEKVVDEKLFRVYDDKGFVALTIDQLKIPLIIHFSLLGLASVQFAIEIIVHRVTNLRKRRQIYIQRDVNQELEV